MKKSAGYLMLLVTALFVCLVAGMFIGRNTNRYYFTTQKLSSSETLPPHQETIKPETIGKVNINTATLEELTLLPGIGEALAERILEYRHEHGPFHNIQEIMNVKGIGESKFADLEHYITTEA